jgi:hypothetical protein
MEKILRRVLIAWFTATCVSGIEPGRAANAEPANPPRTQQDIMKERFADCRELHGAALRECMANYVGPTHDKNVQQDPGAQDDASAKAPAPTRPRQEAHSSQGK